MIEKYRRRGLIARKSLGTFAPSRLRFRPTRGGRRGRPSGQGLVELALVLPVLLLIALITIDFGRALYGWVVLQNSARIAANFAGANSNGWSGGGDANIRAEYEAQIDRDLDTANCSAPATQPDPVFTDGPDTAVPGGYSDTDHDVGDTVVVTLSCTFRPITPFIRDIVAINVPLGASSEFRIRSGELVGLANPTKIPKSRGHADTDPGPHTGADAHAFANAHAGSDSLPDSDRSILGQPLEWQ